MHLSLWVSLTLLAPPALGQPMYKCPDPSGVVKFQQMPCTLQGGGEAVTVKPIPASGIVNLETSEESKRVQQVTHKMSRDRRLLEIEREMGNLESRIDSDRSAMSNEMARLERKKSSAANNLAGATWEQSISEEMSAVAAKYDAMIRNSQSRIDQLRKEEGRLREDQATEKN